jgi:tRNA (adenine22-N1)-methyltransferase
MASARLPLRLQALLDALEHADCLADVACDHAWFAIAAVQSGRAERAVAIDVAAGPLAAADRHVAAAGLGARVATRRGDGLLPLAAGEADVVAAAGIGGRLLAAMLTAAGPDLRGARRLLLSPHGDEVEVRRALALAGWGTRREWLVQERGRRYVQLDVDAEAPAFDPADEAGLFVGYLGRDAEPAAFAAWREANRARLLREVAALERAGDEPARLAQRCAHLRAIDSTIRT